MDRIITITYVCCCGQREQTSYRFTVLQWKLLVDCGPDLHGSSFDSNSTDLLLFKILHYWLANCSITCQKFCMRRCDITPMKCDLQMVLLAFIVILPTTALSLLPINSNNGWIHKISSRNSRTTVCKWVITSNITERGPRVTFRYGQYSRYVTSRSGIVDRKYTLECVRHP